MPQLCIHTASAPTQKDLNTVKIQTAEMKFLRSVKGQTILFKIKNEDIRKELQISPIDEKILERQQKWHEHMLRMEDIQMQY